MAVQIAFWAMSGRPVIRLARVKGPELEPSDLELLRSATQGDEKAFHVLVDRHAPGLFRLAMSLSSSRADAEDICQETFAGAYQSMVRFDARSSVKTWLTKILIRRAAKIWHKSRHSRRSIPIDDTGRGDGVASNPPAQVAAKLSVPSTVRQVDHQMDFKQVIGTLSPEHRDVIVLRELEGFSYDEIAGALKIPRGTVESRLHRARAELRKKLVDYDV
jgi:RNA polymerase sigma-70 factor (ECF subfamily)